ncbi:MAG: serine/threonine-protein kinase, partial [Gemmatimonadetes bacterium]|nr:serine/threonine-protein kinase [Gemmatimonadota bacterium]
PGLIERFHEERRLLARLDHPAIARLYQVGSTDEGRPYLVMEYVEGTAITEHAVAVGLDATARIRLFQKVCRAVQHAHHRLVVHRDLKPGNVLVTPEGEPKLLDFGIAGALEGETQGGAATPAYAAPEQLRGEATGILGDIYSLGVLLYELLTDQRPWPGDRANDAPAPVAPSHLVPGLPVDVDAIVRKAMDPDPDARYWTASLLSDDLDRALDGLTVRAREPTTGYVVSRFVARNRMAVSAAALVVVLVAGFTTITAVQSNRIKAEAARVTRERDEALAVRTFLLEAFGTTGPDVASDLVTSRELLDGRASRLDEEYGDDPALLAEMSGVLAEAYERLGLYADAEPLARRAVTLRTEAEGDPELPNALTTLGWIVHQAGRLDEAGALLNEAVATARRTFRDDHAATARALNDLGVNLEARGDYQAAEANYLESLAMRRRLAGDDAAVVGTTASNLSVVRYRLGDLDGAVEMAREAHETFVRTLGPDHQRAMIVENNLAAMQAAAGDRESARRTYRGILERRRRLLGDRHPNTAASMTALAILLPRGAGDAEAEALLREAVDIQVADLGPDHPEVALTRRHLAMVLQRKGRSTEAAELFEEALRIQRSIVGPDHPAVGETYALMGSSMASAGDLDEALDAYVEAVRIQKSALGGGHVVTSRTEVATAAVLIDLGRPVEARRHLVSGWVALSEQHDPAHLHVQEARIEFVRLHLLEGGVARADSVLGEVERFLTDDQRADRVGRMAIELREGLSDGR